MTKIQKPLKNQKELMTWTVILGVLLLAAAALLWQFRGATESHIHIPETAFEKKPSRPSLSNPAPSRRSMTSSPATANDDGSRIDPPQNPELLRAMELVDQGQWTQAEPLLLQLLAQNPQDESVLLELAMLEILDKHSPQAAQSYLERAIRLSPSNDAAIEELLGVYEQTQAWDQAMQFFESLPEGESQGLIHYAKGTALLGAGRSAEAVELLRRAVYEGDHKAFTARQSLALAYEENGRWQEAAGEYEQLIHGSYKPEQIRIAKIKLAGTFSAQKNYAEARAILDGMLAADPKDRWAARVLEQINHKEQR